MKRLLIPIDFSECSLNALRYGIELAKVTETEIMICHALDVPLPGITDTIIDIQKKYLKAEKDAEALLGKIAQDISSRKNNMGANIKCSLSFIQGDATAVIDDCSEQFKPDYIIMGTVGKNRWDNILGSTTVKSIGKINRSIIVVPLEAEFVGLKNILISIDSPDHHINSIRKVQELARLFSARLVVGHVTTYKEYQEYISGKFNRLKDECHKAGIREIDFQTILSGEGVHAIIDYVEKNNFQLIGLLKEDRSFLEGMFHKSFIKELVMDCRKPLLILHD
jgi:nucleotide-binding universal stress UspA family protein